MTKSKTVTMKPFSQNNRNEELNLENINKILSSNTNFVKRLKQSDRYKSLPPLPKFNAGNKFNHGEIKSDDSNWYQRNIVKPTVTWLNTRPGGPVITLLNMMSSVIPGVGEAIDIANGEPVLAAIGMIPGIGDLLQASGKALNELPTKKITKIAEGQSGSSVKVTKKRNSDTAKKQKETYQRMRSKYGPLDDDKVGNRKKHYQNWGGETSMYGVNNDVGLDEGLQSRKLNKIGNENIYLYPYYEDVGNGVGSTTNNFTLSDFLLNGGKL